MQMSKTCETRWFYYKFCETKRLNFSMVEDEIFQRQNLDGKRTKNYFHRLFFPQKTSKIPCFTAFLPHFGRFWFHMKHTPLFALFHVKHMFLAPFYRLFTPIFELFYPITTPNTNFCVFSLHFLVDFVLFFRFLTPIYTHSHLLCFGQTAFRHRFDSFRAVFRWCFAYSCDIWRLPTTSKPHFPPFPHPCFYHTKAFCHTFTPSTYHPAVVFERLWAVLRGFRGDFDHLFVCVFWPLLRAVWRCCFISTKHVGWLVGLIMLTYASKRKGV